MDTETVAEQQEDVAYNADAIETDEPYQNILALSCEPMKRTCSMYNHHHENSQNKQNWSVIV
jgi:hypothetical protein